MIFAWQGWTISLPSDYNPVKLQGQFDQGQALIADLQGPRLGLRWTTPRKKFQSNDALIQEVGALAAAEAQIYEHDQWKDALRYTEPNPPGRDVWVGHSTISGRALELICHVRQNESSQMDSLLDSFGDTEPTSPYDWSAFDLSCRTPIGWRLESHPFIAGDLRMNFMRASENLSVRQVTLAHLALRRMPLEAWLANQIASRQITQESRQVTVQHEDGRVSQGLIAQVQRRRSFLTRRSPTTVLALHDQQRDRLLFIEAATIPQAQELAQSTGWAHTEHALACGR